MGAGEARGADATGRATGDDVGEADVAGGCQGTDISER